jgi:hypothetical protein
MIISDAASVILRVGLIFISIESEWRVTLLGFHTQKYSVTVIESLVSKSK